MPTLEEIFGAPAKTITPAGRPPLESIFAEPAEDEDMMAAAIGDPYGALTMPGEVSPTRETIATIARPVLEAGGTIAGAALAVPASVAAGPAAPAVVAGGGGLGYAAGSNLADILEQTLGLQEAKSVMEELAELPREVAVGASYELGGQLIVPAAKALGPTVAGAVSGAAGGAYLDKENRLRGAMIGIPTGAVSATLLRRSLSQKGIARKAYDKLIAEIQGTELTQPQIDKNVKIAKTLQEHIRKETGKDFKFTQGQLTNDPSAIALERSLARKGGEDMSQAQREYANTILDEYYAKKAVGAGVTRAFPERVERLRKGLEAATQEAEDAVSTEVARLSRHMDEQVMGKSIHGFLSEGKKKAKKEATKLYNSIPNVKLPSANLNQGIDDLIKLEDNIIEPRTQQMVDLINRHTIKNNEPVEVGYQTLRKIRSRIGQNARAAGSGANPNLEDARQLDLLLGKVDDAMAQVEHVNPKIAEAYNKATSFYREEYIPRFRQGTVANVLQRGARGEDTKIAMANIAKAFNSLDGIDDLTRAVGNDRNVARQAMKDFYSFDLLNAAQNRETLQLTAKRATAWLSKNAGKLRKLGIYDEFADVAKMQRAVEANAKHLDVFNKSVAGKVLESDLQTMVSNAFRGSRNYAKTANELMRLAKGDKAAEQGLKKAFAENLFRQAETSAPKFFQAGETMDDVEFIKSLAKLTAQMRKFRPAIREMYKLEPERVKAMNTVWKAYMTLGRTAKSPVGAGSDTFELFGKTLDIVAGSTAPGKWYAFKAIRDIIDRFGSDHVDVFLKKAMFDPDYAQTLKAIAEGEVREAKVNQLMTLISYEIGETLQGEE